ncbi:MAG TPA: hypothetical protein IAC72_05125 [Candidatus Fimimonas merdipullorum]|uniref:Bacterial repeat domain-containing protein n=1 Tax=Candidatus Fimimonas merdipullorum TaxID=2840822 RepID=A0A9D1MY11_9BACT|nr:hypothetical protein [Candidatus Fimimonas merdipullorum]
MQNTKATKLRIAVVVIAAVALLSAGLALLLPLAGAQAQQLDVTLVNDEALPWIYDSAEGAYRSDTDMQWGTYSNLTVQINQAGDFTVQYRLCCFDSGGDAPSADSWTDFFYFTHIHADGTSDTLYGYYTGVTQEYASQTVAVEAGDEIVFTMFVNAMGFDAENERNAVWLRLPCVSSDVEVKVTCDESLGSVTVNGGEVAPSYLAGTTLSFEAQPTEGNTFLYWTDNGRIVSRELQYTVTAGFPLDIEAVFCEGQYADTYTPSKLEDGSDSFTYQNDAGWDSYSDNLKGQSGSAELSITFVGEKYLYLETVLEEESGGGSLDVIVDGVWLYTMNSSGAEYAEWQTFPVLGEGMHEILLRFNSDGAYCTTWMNLWTPETAVTHDVVFNYDGKYGQLYIDDLYGDMMTEDTYVAPGSVLTLINSVRYDFYVTMPNTVASSIDPSKQVEIDFGGYYEGDVLLANGLYSWIYFGGEDGSTIQFNIRFVEAPPVPEITAMIEVDGEQQQRELQSGDIIKVPYGSDSAVRISIGDFAEIEEQLIVTDNGGDISELVYDDGCWVIGFGNVSTLHNVAIYSILGEMESEVFYVKIIPVTESDFSDLIVAGSSEVVVSSPDTLNDSDGEAVENFSPWVYYPQTDGTVAYRAGNSFVDSSFSLITFTVTGSGAFTMEVMFDSQGGYSDYIMYSVGYYIYDRYDHEESSYVEEIRDNCGWTKYTFEITAAENEQTTIYLAYTKNGSKSEGLDIAAVRNVGFFDGASVVNYVTSGEYGSVTGSVNSGGSVAQGTTITLTAAPGDGNTFYGWLNGEGELVSTAETFSVIVTDEQTYIAVIMPQNHYAAGINGVFYTDLPQALAAAAGGDTVVLLRDEQLTQNVTVPVGVTLLVPYSSARTFTETGSGENAINRVSWYTEQSAQQYLYRTLTVDSGVTLTVHGTLVVGAVCHYPDQSAQGHTSGAYGKLVNNGEIVLEGGAAYYSYGLTSGSGVVTAQSGSEVYQPFVVHNFSGGTNTYALYNAGQFPFLLYSTVNIQCTLTVHYGAKEIGMASLYFWGAVTTQNVLVVSYDGNADLSFGPGLIVLKQGAYLTKTYDGTRYVTSSTSSANINSDAGVSTVTISGGATAGVFSLQGFGSEEMVLALPYTFEMILTNGVYDVNHAYKVMPGAILTVEEDATLNVNAGGSLAVYDGLAQSAMSGKRYATTEELTSAGFSPSGVFTVNGTLNVYGAFAGVINTQSEGAKLHFADTAVTQMQVTEGALSSYDANISQFDLTARAAMTDSDGTICLLPLAAGTDYEVLSLSHTATLTDYTANYLVNCSAGDADMDADYTAGETGYHKWSTQTVTLNVTVRGSFIALHEHAYSVEVITAPTATAEGKISLTCTFPGCTHTAEQTVAAYGMPAVTYFEGITLGDITLPEGWQWQQPDVNVYCDTTSAVAAWNGIYSVQVNIVIMKATVAKPASPQTTVFTYDGNEKTVEIATGEHYTVSGNTATNAGSYTATVKLVDTANYTWSDGSTADVEITWSIAKADVDMSGVTFNDVTATYTGQEITAVVENLPELLTVSYSYDGSNIQPGVVTATATFAFANEADSQNYNLPQQMTATVTINKVVVAKPASPQITVFTYDGAEKVLEIATGEHYTVTGNTATNAGSYTATVKLVDTANYTWSDGSTADVEITWSIEKASVTKPAAETEQFTYDGTEKTVIAAGEHYTVSGNTATNAGSYTATVKLVDTANYTWSDGSTADAEIHWSIAKADVDMSEVAFNDVTATYTGQAITAVVDNLPQLLTVSYSYDGSNVEPGVVTATATFAFADEADSQNYNLPQQMTAQITINKVVVAKPATPQTTVFTYDGAEKVLEIEAGEHYTVTGNTATNAGDYTSTVTLTDKAHCEWSGGTTEDVTISWEIAKASVTKPEPTTVQFTYDGTEKTVIAAGEHYTVSGNTATNAGSYTATLKLVDTANYTWSDGSTADVEITWSIEKASVTKPEAETAQFTYDGTEKTVIAAGEQYTVSGNTATNAGSYTATVTLTDTANYTWSDGSTADVEITWSIAKADYPDFTLSAVADGVSITAECSESGVQFSVDGKTWQSAAVFTGLTPGSTYTLTAKIEGDANHNDKIVSVQITTDDLSEAKEALAAVENADDNTLWQKVSAAQAELNKLSEAERAALDTTGYNEAIARYNAKIAAAKEDLDKAQTLADAVTPVAAVYAMLAAAVAGVLKKFF